MLFRSGASVQLEMDWTPDHWPLKNGLPDGFIEQSKWASSPMILEATVSESGEMQGNIHWESMEMAVSLLDKQWKMGPFPIAPRSPVWKPLWDRIPYPSYFDSDSKWLAQLEGTNDAVLFSLTPKQGRDKAVR